jgi:hypothetical protein
MTRNPRPQTGRWRRHLAAIAGSVIVAAGLVGCAVPHPATPVPPPEMAWQTNDVTALAGAPAAAFVLPASYVSEAQGTQHLIYLGFTDNHLHELWSDATGWHTDDLTAATGAPEPLPDHLTAYMFEAEGTGHVIYVGAADNHIHELFSDATGWHTDDLTAATGAPPAGTGPLVAYAFEAQRTQHVFYLDASYVSPHFHELWSDNTGWHTDDLTAATGAPPHVGSDVAGFADEAHGTQHLFYTAGGVHELWWDNTGWHTDEVGVNGYDLAGYVFDTQGTHHLTYTAGTGAKNHLHELWWDSTGRHTTDLTAATGDSAGNCGAMVAYAVETNATRHVFEVGCRDHHVHELWSDGTGWHADDLTAATGALAPEPTLGNGVGLTGYPFKADGTQHLFYVSDLDNHIHQLLWGPKPAPQPGSATTTTPSSTAPAGPAVANDRFVGHWHVHGADLDITPTTTTYRPRVYLCSPESTRLCREAVTFSVVSGDDMQLTLQVAAVSRTDETGASVPDPTAPAVGDEVRLDWQAPGLLKSAILHWFAWSIGNPYWCGSGISPVNHRLCGA